MQYPTKSDRSHSGSAAGARCQTLAMVSSLLACASRRKAADREIARYHDIIDLERRYEALERRDDNLWRRGTLPFQGP